MNGIKKILKILIIQNKISGPEKLHRIYISDLMFKKATSNPLFLPILQIVILNTKSPF